MSTTPQSRALARHRKRLRERGLSRYEVRGLDADKDLVRNLAKRLAAGDAAAARLRAEMQEKIEGAPSRRGSILAALRRSPLVGADLAIQREVGHGRKTDL